MSWHEDAWRDVSKLWDEMEREYTFCLESSKDGRFPGFRFDGLIIEGPFWGVWGGVLQKAMSWLFTAHHSFIYLYIYVCVQTIYVDVAKLWGVQRWLNMPCWKLLLRTWTFLSYSPGMAIRTAALTFSFMVENRRDCYVMVILPLKVSYVQRIGDDEQEEEEDEVSFFLEWPSRTIPLQRSLDHVTNAYKCSRALFDGSCSGKHPTGPRSQVLRDDIMEVYGSAMRESYISPLLRIMM